MRQVVASLDHLGPVPYPVKMRLVSLFVSQKLVSWTAKRNKEDLLALKGLLESGRMAPVIDRTYPLSEVPDGMRYLEEGHVRGKVVITVENTS